MSTERPLDANEQAIIRALIRDPRASDNAVGNTTGVNVRTVSRKRQRLEEDGVLSYFALDAARRLRGAGA